MTVEWFSGMTIVMSFPRKRESRKYFFSKQIKGKESGSPIKLRMTACVLSRMTFTLDSLIVDFRNVKRHRMTKRGKNNKKHSL